MDVLITLTTAGADTGPFNLYSNVDSYTTAFETGVAKSALVAGYLSTVVPASTTYVRVKSTGRCTNYIDIFVVGSATTTTTTTNVPPTTTTTTTEVVTYYNVVLCGTSTPSVIRHNGPNNVTLGVVVQSSNGSCYTVSSVGTGPETVGTLLTQFNDCATCQGAPPPTTTTTTTATPTTTTTTTASPTTTTTTTTATPTTTTTTTAGGGGACYTYTAFNNSAEVNPLSWTNCDGSPAVENVQPFQEFTTPCALQNSVSGPNFTITTLARCDDPTPPTTTTTTAPPATTTTTTTGGINHPYQFPITVGWGNQPSACNDASTNISVWGDFPQFIDNNTYYYTQISNIPYDGSNLYYRNTNGSQYVQISSTGQRLDQGNC